MAFTPETVQQQPKATIALVDDDAQLSAMLGEYLQHEGFAVEYFYDGQAAVTQIQQNAQFSVIVLDIMMPVLDGLSALQQLRQNIDTPIIMLTGRGDDIDRIIGLEMGADDYLAKPCNPRELLARLRALIRRSQTRETPTSEMQALCLGGIRLDRHKRAVEVEQQPLALTSAEFDVLQLLMLSSGQSISKEQLSEQVLQRQLGAYDRSIDVHVSRIRKKLAEASPGSEHYIKTLRGKGYQFTC